MSPVPRPAEPHASFRGKEVSEAQRPQHLDTTPEADKIFLEINRGQAGGGSTTSYLRQTAPHQGPRSTLASVPAPGGRGEWDSDILSSCDLNDEHAIMNSA